MQHLVHEQPRRTRRWVYAVVNRENGLPVLIFTQRRPNLEDPPAVRGMRLLMDIWHMDWQERPQDYPWIHDSRHLEEIARTGFRVVEVPHGLVLEIE